MLEDAETEKESAAEADGAPPKKKKRRSRWEEADEPGDQLAKLTPGGVPAFIELANGITVRFHLLSPFCLKRLSGLADSIGIWSMKTLNTSNLVDVLSRLDISIWSIAQKAIHLAKYPHVERPLRGD